MKAIIQKLEAEIKNHQQSAQKAENANDVIRHTYQELGLKKAIQIIKNTIKI